jgi:hypothetical protein
MSTINNAINANTTSPLPIIDGGTGFNAVTIAPAATAWAGWDANKNLSMNNALEGYATTATAAGTTTLTVASAYQQFFTGSTTQTVQMPVTSTLVLGQSWLIVNNSSGVVTVQSSGSNTITSMAPATQAIITCILTSGTTAASWNSDYGYNTAGVSTITGTANQVIASASIGAVMLSTPQSIGTSSNVQFGSVSFSTTSGIIGTTTNDNAAAGSVGEFVSSVVPAGPVALTSATTANITSISLTAGDWDVYGDVVYSPSIGPITVTNQGSSDTSVTFGPVSTFSSETGSNLGFPSTPIPYRRFSLASTTTIYLVVNVTYSAGTLAGYGSIFARRAR